MRAITVLGLTHLAGVRIAEVAFLHVLFEGIWLAVGQNALGGGVIDHEWLVGPVLVAHARELPTGAPDLTADEMDWTRI